MFDVHFEFFIKIFNFAVYLLNKMQVAFLFLFESFSIKSILYELLN